jgi:hypothetical protein
MTTANSQRTSSTPALVQCLRQGSSLAVRRDALSSSAARSALAAVLRDGTEAATQHVYIVPRLRWIGHYWVAYQDLEANRAEVVLLLRLAEHAHTKSSRRHFLRISAPGPTHVRTRTHPRPHQDLPNAWAHMDDWSDSPVGLTDRRGKPGWSLRPTGESVTTELRGPRALRVLTALPASSGRALP